MKKSASRRLGERDPEGMQGEYDFSRARPNPYASRYAQGSLAVVLDPDVGARFPDAAAVNEALRSIPLKRQPRRKRSLRRSR